jgi:S-DNA-T family DNA segregation ATPase FtsK/SpoIIIE
VKHPDDDNELFNRLEAELAADSGGDVVDLDAARSARAESADPGARPDADRSADSRTVGSGIESADQSTPVLVDSPTLKAAGPGYLGRLAGAKRRAVVPLWLRSLSELKTASGWVARHYAHTAGYHALRAPVYAARLALQAPTGAARFVGGTMRWVADREGEPVRLAAVRREDAAEYLKLSRQRDGRVRLRTLVAGYLRARPRLAASPLRRRPRAGARVGRSEGGRSGRPQGCGTARGAEAHQ